MLNELISVFATIALFVLLPILLVAARGRLEARSTREIRDEVERYEARLQHSDCDSVARHFDCAFPEALRALYADTEEILREDFDAAPFADAPEEDRWYIAFYHPCDMQTVEGAWEDVGHLFAFANDGAGNDYVVDPRDPDPPVHFHDHETGEMTPVADRLSDFMAWPRFDVEE